MTPKEVEIHARSAKRQFEALGLDSSHIEPEEMRDLAAEEAALMAWPATVGDIENLKEEIGELKRLILSMKPAAPVINISSGYGTSDAIGRSMYHTAAASR